MTDQLVICRRGFGARSILQSPDRSACLDAADELPVGRSRMSWGLTSGDLRVGSRLPEAMRSGEDWGARVGTGSAAWLTAAQLDRELGLEDGVAVAVVRRLRTYGLVATIHPQRPPRYARAARGQPLLKAQRGSF
jgi:hypothetical protein